jgi:hypothetical protein
VCVWLLTGIEGFDCCVVGAQQHMSILCAAALCRTQSDKDVT